jgi:hypothetical protein
MSKIRVFSLSGSLNDLLMNWPTFANNKAAIEYLKDNSDHFRNGDTIAIVDFTNLTTIFVEARFTMDFITKEKGIF